MPNITKVKKRILIVDDNPGVRESIRLSLEGIDLLEIEVFESTNVSSGLEQLQKVNPDVIILDINKPGKNGFDFLDLVNKNGYLNKTEVIMLSADDTMQNILKAGDKGIDEFLFLGKPFNVSELQALVLSVCLPIKAQ